MRNHLRGRGGRGEAALTPSRPAAAVLWFTLLILLSGCSGIRSLLHDLIPGKVSFDAVVVGGGVLDLEGLGAIDKDLRFLCCLCWFLLPDL